MKSFNINTYQPTLSTFCYLNEINNKNYLDINKFIGSNDNTGLNNYFNNLLHGLNGNTNYDKFFALLYLRQICIGSTLKLQIDKESTLTIKLLNILQRLLDSPQEPLKDFTFKDLTIKFKLPSNLYYSNFISFLFDIIEDLIVNNDFTNYKDQSDSKKLKIIKNLKKEILKEIKKHIKINQKRYKLIQIEEEADITKFSFSFYDNSAFYTLKFLFKSNISVLYNKLYHSMQKLKLNFDDYNGITPSETNILLAIYKKSNNIK